MQLENPKYKESYEFEPSEWITSEGANTEFNEICKTLYTEVLKERLDFEKFKNELFESCVQVLEKLRKEKFFNNELNNDLLIMFSISDTNESEENQIKWVKRLNTKKVGKRFEGWMNYEYE